MRILSYNIKSGGYDDYEYQTKFPPRNKLIKHIVDINKPDIVSFIDTFRWDEIYTNDELCKIFNFKYAYCINLGDERLKKLGHNNGITVLSNLKNTKFETINLLSRNCIHSEFQGSNGIIDLFSLYLDDLSEDTRLNQINELLKYVNGKRPTLLIGDLNTLSPKDVVKTKEKVNLFINKNPKYKILEKLLNEMARAKVVTKLFDLGFNDVSTDFMSTFPTKLTNISKEAFLRIDFCLSNNISVKKCKVLKGEIYDKTSDHYPILLEI